MVTKAIVADISDKYNIKVRIPIYNRASFANQKTVEADLPTATSCVLPNSSLNLRVGDIVYVSFEDDDKGRPVILGCLYMESGNGSTCGSIFADSINVTANAVLPSETSIGKVSSKELGFLTGMRENAQFQIDTLSRQFQSSQEDVSDLQDAVETLRIDVGNKSTLYAHKVSFYISNLQTTVYINLLTNSSTPLVVSDLIDSQNFGNPDTIDKITNTWGIRYYSGATERGVGILMSVSYNNNQEEWRALVMNVINYDGTVEVVELTQSSISGFSDTVIRL